MKVLKAHHIGLCVSDIDCSVDFYCANLQMTVKMRREINTPWVGEVNGQPGVALQVAFLEAEGQTLELLQFSPAGPALEPSANQPGAAHLTFLVDNVDEAYQELSERGVRFVSSPQVNTEGPNAGSRVVFLLDPDHFRIELVQAPPDRAQFP